MSLTPTPTALRRPVTVMVLLAGVVFAGLLAFERMKVDIFPPLDLPVIYVAQPYGGMDPQQMEGLIANYYEYHFLYITGIHHVESKNVQGVSLMKLFFHPGTDMAQAMAETVGYVNRSRAFMPPGTVATGTMARKLGPPLRVVAPSMLTDSRILPKATLPVAEMNQRPRSNSS